MTRDDVLFFLGVVGAAAAAGWLWSCFEFFMRVDIHV